MPLVLDEESAKGGGGGGGGPQLQELQTLFWKSVPVQLRQGDREDQAEELTFRILTGFSKQNHNLRVGDGPNV